MKNTVFIEPRSKHVNQMLARELAKRSIPENVYLSRVGKKVIFEIPEDIYGMLRKDSDVRPGKDYGVVAGSDRRVRRSPEVLEELIKKGLVTRGPKKKARRRTAVT